MPQILQDGSGQLLMVPGEWVGLRWAEGRGGDSGQGDQRSADTELDYTPRMWDRERKQFDGIEEAFSKV